MINPEVQLPVCRKIYEQSRENVKQLVNDWQNHVNNTFGRVFIAGLHSIQVRNT